MIAFSLTAKLSLSLSVLSGIPKSFATITASAVVNSEGRISRRVEALVVRWVGSEAVAKAEGVVGDWGSLSMLTMAAEW